VKNVQIRGEGNYLAVTQIVNQESNCLSNHWDAPESNVKTPRSHLCAFAEFMPSKRIAFATCADYRALSRSDQLAAELLKHHGWDVEPVVWTETPAATLNADVVVLRSVWDYHLRVEEFLAWIDNLSRSTLVLNHPDLVHWNADKRYLLDLSRAGFDLPRLIRLEEGEKRNLAELLQEQNFNRAVLKPVVSASGFQTHALTRADCLSFQAEFESLARSRAMLLQEYVPEITTNGEWSLMFFGGGYSHAVRKLPKLGDFRVQAEYGGTHQIDPPPKPVLNVAKRVVEQFAANTVYARIDVVERGSSPLIMELELIDPELFLTDFPDAVHRLVASLEEKIRAGLDHHEIVF
jgi:hypothetical protein